MERRSPPKGLTLEKALLRPLAYLQNMPQELLLKLAAEILNKPAEDRDERHKKILHVALQEVNFFKKMIDDKGTHLFEQCLDRIRHSKMKQDQVVCSIGEKGSTFYVLLKGEVSVSVHVQKIDEKIALKSKGKRMTTYLDLQEVSVLKAGSYFGELALLNDAPRTATIVCREDCEFAVLSREDFKEILARHTLWQVGEDIKFFSALPLFATSTTRAISTLIYHFKILKLQRNKVIFKEGDEATHLFIIKKGEVRISKTVSVMPETDAFTKEDEIKPPKPVKKVLELAILGQNEIFGEEELYYGTKRDFTATVFSLEADIYALEKKDFQKRLMETREFMAYLKSYCKEKTEARSKRIQFIMETAENNKGVIWTKAHKPLSASPMKHVRRKYQKEATERVSGVDSPVRKQTIDNTKSVFQDHSPVSALLQPIDLSRTQSPLLKLGSLSTHQSPRIRYRSSLSPSPSRIKLLQNATNRHFFQTQQGSPKKFVKIAGLNNNSNKKLMLSSPTPPRHRSLPHSTQYPSKRDLNILDPTPQTRTLFEKKIFERNQPSPGASRIKIRTNRNNDKALPNLNMSIGADQSPGHSPHHLQSARATRAYFSSRSTEPKRIMEYQSSLIKARDMLLTTKFHHQVDQECLIMGHSDETTLRKQVKTPVLPARNISLVDRIKNLPCFQSNPPQNVAQELPDVKNIHVHAKKMQAFTKDVLKTQLRIFNHIHEKESQTEKFLGDKVKTLNKTIMVCEPVARDDARSSLLNHSELMANPAMTSLVGLHMNEQLNWSSVEPSARDLVPSPGMTVRSYHAKSNQEL